MPLKLHLTVSELNRYDVTLLITFNNLSSLFSVNSLLQNKFFTAASSTEDIETEIKQNIGSCIQDK